MDDLMAKAKTPKDKASDVNTELSYIQWSEEQDDIQTPSDTYTPEGYDDQESYLADLRETYQLDLDADDINRKNALEDLKFAAGEQWDPVVLQQRQGLPCLSINTIPQFVAQLVGDWRENRTGVKVLPANDGDKNIADIRADLIRNIETKSRADRIYDSAFESMVMCGDGAFRVGVQYTDGDVFDQDIALQPIDDALSVVWDRLSIDPTGRDAHHCFVDDLIPLKEFNKRWPEADPSQLNRNLYRDLYSAGWVGDKAARVTEHWRMIERKRLIALFADGSIHEMTAENLAEVQAKHGKPTKLRHAPCKYAQMHLTTGYKILAGPFEWRLNRLPIIRMSGRVVPVGDRRVRYGLVRFMKDAVRLRNFWRSVAAEQLGYAPKAQWMATESAVEGREAAIRRAHLSRDPLLVFNDEAIFGQNVTRVEPPPMQMALINESQINTQDMKDVTGIHDASLGIPSNETSGRAIMARQREGDVSSITYYDNGNNAVLEGGDVMNQLIGQIYDGTRIIRAVGEDESVKLVKINDPNNPKSPNLAVGDYDVAISTGASYTTRRVEAAEAMMEAIQVYPQLMSVAGDLVVKAQDWPGAEELAERLLKTVPPQLLSQKEREEQGPQAPNAQAMAAQQAQMQEQVQKMQQLIQKLETENLVYRTKHDTEQVKLKIEQYNAETQRLMAYSQILKDDETLNLKRFEQEADIAMTTLGHAHEASLAAADAHHEAGMTADQQAHEMNMTSLDQSHQADMQDQQLQAQQQAEASPGDAD